MEYDHQQAELFAVAAAVNGKDYWCLSAIPGGGMSYGNSGERLL